MSGTRSYTEAVERRSRTFVRAASFERICRKVVLGAACGSLTSKLCICFCHQLTQGDLAKWSKALGSGLCKRPSLVRGARVRIPQSSASFEPFCDSFALKKQSETSKKASGGRKLEVQPDRLHPGA